jgi:hypothetical protein
MLSRGMFVSDKEWMEALGTIGARVPHAVEEHGTSTRRVLRTLGWVFGLLVLFLAWHFAQIKK